MVTRRRLFTGMAALASAAVGKSALAALPEIVSSTATDTRAPLAPPNGRPYRPVATLNGWTLPWRMRAGVKEFHLVAEPVVREIAPGMKANLWGYNGQSPGPTIEVVEGDRHQPPPGAHQHSLARPAAAEWHGRRIRPQSTVHQARTDVRIRVSRRARRNLHVSPARG